MANLFVCYRGTSMWPLFQEGDLIEVERLPCHRVRRGDCVVFGNAAGEQTIHRVVAAGSRLRTRGDALPTDDHGQVTEEILVGKAVRRYRLGCTAPVLGGWPGLLAGCFYRLAGRIDPDRPARGGTVARTLRRLTMSLPGNMTKWGEVRIVVRAGLEPIVVWYWGKWAVGRQEPGTGRWVVYWPWRVIFSGPRP